ncbi:MAG: hypothetical protein HKN73_19805, partial [Gemmatimonadetes bacterium]|nr:hypothetical protein [Gemmatimonadota bacterium]
TAQIAQELGMAHRTVTTHLSNIYKRLGLTKDEYGDRLREELRRLVVEGHL